MLPSAKSGVLIKAPSPIISSWWRRIAIAVGVVAILVGGADAFSRLAHTFMGVDAGFFSFAPAALIVEPGLWGQIQDTSTVSFTPTALIVPAIEVNALVEQVSIKADGSMGTPKRLADVAWYAPGSMPGEPGNAVFAGHVNNALGLPGVFTNLAKLKVGDTVEVIGEGGQVLTYAVENINEYYLESAPLAEIFARSGSSRVVLITCQGSWDQQTRTYDKRLVVVARLLNP